VTAPTVEQLISTIPRSLGAYAPVLEEIQAALESPQCSLVSIGDAIEKEPDLTARLLKLGNSAFYGYSSRLSTVTEAVSLMGIQQVQDLILASSIIEHFAGMPDDFINMNSFWRHSLACGICARAIAQEKRLPKSDKFFVAGLLHDIGRLVLLLQAPEATKQIITLYRSQRILLQDAEMSILGYDHQTVGAHLLRHWRYPELLVRAVGNHHETSINKSPVIEAVVVGFSDYLVSALQLGSSGEQFVPPLAPQTWETLGLTPESLDSLVSALDQQMEAVEETFLSN
jgi:putative nucleotidyltransferase with HDIG domain